jgi:predicted MFS family arabinose efflux permease
MDRRTRGVIAAAFVAQALGIGATIGAFSLFVRPIADGFSATTFEASAGLSLITMMLAMCGVPIGGWLDRGSPRHVMFTGCTILGATLLFASQAQSLLQLALACLVAGVAVPMLGPLTTAAVVSKATTGERGRALGMANLGVPIGGVFFAILGGTLIDGSGWRTALQTFAIVVCAVGYTAIYFGIPKDLGAQSSDEAIQSSTDDSWPPGRLVKSPIFLLIAAAIGMGMGTNAGWISQAASFLHDQGATSQIAGVVIGATQGSMLIGTLYLGALVDRRDGVMILICVFAVQAVCFAIMMTGPGLSVLTAALIVFGIAAGGYLPVFGHLLAGQFGAANTGRTMGLANLAMLPFGFGLPMITGGMRDSGGDYQGAILLCIGILSCGIAVLVALSRKLKESALEVEQPKAA